MVCGRQPFCKQHMYVTDVRQAYCGGAFFGKLLGKPSAKVFSGGRVPTGTLSEYAASI